MERTKKKEYLEATGRRKTSSARVRIYPGQKGDFIVNNKKLTEYFCAQSHIINAKQPIEILNLPSNFKVNVIVKGGGLNSQAGAIRHGLARALVLFNPEFRKKMKDFQLLTRDPRMKERKKPGLKRARRAPQWRKR